MNPPDVLELSASLPTLAGHLYLNLWLHSKRLTNHKGWVVFALRDAKAKLYIQASNRAVSEALAILRVFGMIEMRKGRSKYPSQLRIIEMTVEAKNELLMALDRVGRAQVSFLLGPACVKGRSSDEWEDLSCYLRGTTTTADQLAVGLPKIERQEGFGP